MPSLHLSPFSKLAVVGEDQRGREREVDGGDALWEISDISLMHGYSPSGACGQTVNLPVCVLSWLSGRICLDLCHKTLIGTTAKDNPPPKEKDSLCCRT